MGLAARPVLALGVCIPLLIYILFILNDLI